MLAIPNNQKIVLLNLFGILEEVFAQAQTTTRRSVTTRDMSRVFMDYQELIIKILQTLIIEKEQIFKENKF